MHYYIKPTGGEWDCGVLLPLPFPKQGKDNRGFASYERMVRFAEKHKLSGPHLVQIRENGVTTMSIEVDLPLTHCSLFKRL